MKITKYSQFTFKVENNAGVGLLIDPGKYNYSENFTTNHFGNVDIMIITHKHADHHFWPAEIEIIKNQSPIVYTNHEIGQEEEAVSNGYVIRQVGDIIEEAGFKITLINTDHFAKGESIINFGMLIEADGKSFYHTSDTRFMEPNMYDNLLVSNPDVLAVPISNRGVVMGIDDSIVFTSHIKPKIVVPAHYDSPKDKPRVNPQDFSERFSVLQKRIPELENINVEILDFGNSITL